MTTELFVFFENKIKRIIHPLQWLLNLRYLLLAGLLYCAGYAQTGEANSVASWLLDEGSGTIAVDSSGNNHTGELLNGPGWVNGQFGTALEFDGANDYVSVPSSNDFDFRTAFTLSAWIKPATVTNKQVVISKQLDAAGNWTSFSLRLESTGKLRVSLQNSITDDHPDWFSSDILSPNTWYHVVFAWEVIDGTSNDGKLYIDGQIDNGGFQADGYGAGFVMGFNPGGSIGIGRYELETPSSYFDGLIDEVRLYDRMLSDVEVLGLFLGPTDPTPPSVPQDLNVDDTTETRADLSWSASSDPESGVSIYRIYRDSIFVGASTTTTFANTGLEENTTYIYEVSAVNGSNIESAMSDPVLATTLSDSMPPLILSVVASLNSVQILFNEPLEGISATNVNNYSIVDNNADNIAVTEAVLGPDSQTVTLTTSNHMVGASYILTVIFVEDVAGNAIAETQFNYQLGDDFIAYWKFDEGSGTIAGDSSGNSHNGDLINGPAWVEGRFGTALLFDELMEQRILIGNSPDLNLGDSSFSIVLWIKYDNCIDCDILRKGSSATANDWYKLEVVNNKISFDLKTDQIDPNNTAFIQAPFSSNDGDWHHVAGVRDSERGIMSLYIDGAVAAELTDPPGSVSNSANLVIGSKDTEDDDFLNGTLDDLAFYSRALTPEEVQELYSDPTDLTPPSVPQDLGVDSTTEAQVDLSWSASADAESGISSYRIYRDGVLVGTSVVTAFSDTGLDQNTNYTYEVSAVNGGSVESGLSDPVSATTLPESVPPSIVSVIASLDAVQIVFDEPLDSVSATDVSNYAIDNGIVITDATLGGDLQTMTLATSEHMAGTLYTLTVSLVSDINGNAMPETAVNYLFGAGLMAYWKFDEGAGTTAGDSSGNDHTGELVNGPSWVPGHFGNALEFDGVNDYVSVPSSIDFDTGTALTLSAWINPATVATRQVVISKQLEGAGGWTSFSLRLESDGKLRVSLQNNITDDHPDWFSNSVLLPDTWYHVVFAWEVVDGTSNDGRLYIDGQPANGGVSGGRIQSWLCHGL